MSVPRTIKICVYTPVLTTHRTSCCDRDNTFVFDSVSAFFGESAADTCRFKPHTSNGLKQKLTRRPRYLLISDLVQPCNAIVVYSGISSSSNPSRWTEWSHKHKQHARPL